MRFKKQLFYPVMAALLIISIVGAGLWFVQPTKAVHTLDFAPPFCSLQSRVLVEENGLDRIYLEQWRCKGSEVLAETGFCVVDTYVYVLESDGIEVDYEFAGDIPISEACSAGEEDFVAPALWLMALCEPNDGFSDDGWMSWDGEPDGVLYVAASADGPWYPTEFKQPPYIMNETHLNGLAAWMGLADWHQLWFKNSEEGQQVLVGNAVAERDGHMDEYCGE